MERQLRLPATAKVSTLSDKEGKLFFELYSGAYLVTREIAGILNYFSYHSLNKKGEYYGVSYVSPPPFSMWKL